MNHPVTFSLPPVTCMLAQKCCHSIRPPFSFLGLVYLLSRINAAYVFQHCSTDLEPSSWLFEASHLRLGASMNLSATHLILYHPCLSLTHPIQSQFLSGMAQKPGACMCQMGRHCKALPADLKFVPGPKPTHITCGTTNC